MSAELPAEMVERMEGAWCGGWDCKEVCWRCTLRALTLADLSTLAARLTPPHAVVPVDPSRRGMCKTCRRDMDHPLFDGCMNPNCPHGFEPCR